MKFTIIGLGNFGRVLAEELTALGHEVVAADIEMSKVDAVKDKVTIAYRLDAADNLALSRLPLMESDVVIVTIGENFGDSIKVVAMLKQMGVKHIYARAIDNIHTGVLQAFAIERVLNPEEASARMLVHSLDSGVGLESFMIDSNYYVQKFQVPESLVGQRVSQLRLAEDFDIRVLCVCRAKKSVNFLGTSVYDNVVDNVPTEDFELTAEDKLVCFGSYKNFSRLMQSL
jgi:trk system potassium uptake protein TrkA